MSFFRYCRRSDGPHIPRFSCLSSFLKLFYMDTFQLNIFYNLDSGVFSQNLHHATEKEAFSLDVAVTMEADQNHMLLSICTR